MIISLCLFILLLFPESTAQADHPSYQAAVAAITRFYRIVSDFESEGVPDFDDINTLAPCLSKEFKAALWGAREKEEEYQKHSPEPVPPLIEGSLFCSLFEGFTSIDGIAPKGKHANNWHITFRYDPALRNHNDAEGKPYEPFTWVDRASTTVEHGRVVIDDVELLNQGSFGLRGSVKELLKELMSQ